jgi:carbon storage regulator
MLVLTRKLMERLYIGDEICVTVVRLEGGQVRLGIDAPRDVPVVRAELVPNRPAPRFRSNSNSRAIPGPNGPATSGPNGPATPGPNGPAITGPNRPQFRDSQPEARGTDSRRRGRFR